jgi:hypothetical protein
MSLGVSYPSCAVSTHPSARYALVVAAKLTGVRANRGYSEETEREKNIVIA